MIKALESTTNKNKRFFIEALSLSAKEIFVFKASQTLITQEGFIPAEVQESLTISGFLSVRLSSFSFRLKPGFGFKRQADDFV